MSLSFKSSVQSSHKHLIHWNESFMLHTHSTHWRLGAQTPEGGTENGFLVFSVSLRNTPWGGQKGEDKKIYIGRNLWPQAQNESMERHCFVCTTEILRKTNLLSASSAGPELIECGPRARSTSSTASAKLPSQTPNCDAQWIKQKVRRHLISPITESLIQRHNWLKKTNRTEKRWPESRVSSPFILKCKSLLKFVKVHYLQLIYLELPI